MCFMQKTPQAMPVASYSPPPTPTKATIGEEEGVKLAKKEQQYKDQAGLNGMKITLNTGAETTGSGTPGGNVSV